MTQWWIQQIRGRNCQG